MSSVWWVVIPMILQLAQPLCLEDKQQDYVNSLKEVV